MRHVIGGFATAPVIGTRYPAFGRAGSLRYPTIPGLAWLLIVRKISGWSIQGNIWAIYLLLRVHNQIVAGSSDAYLLYILGSLPQDLVILRLVEVAAKDRFVRHWRRAGAQSYGK